MTSSPARSLSAVVPLAMSDAALLVVAFFAVRWLPRHPHRAALVLALQAGAFLAALAPVFLMHW